jgi:hypothetical protein
MPDHCGGKAKRHRLQHQAFGGVPSFDIDVTATSISVFDRRALKGPGDADRQWRRRDPVLPACSADELLPLAAGRNQEELVARSDVVIYSCSE